MNSRFTNYYYIKEAFQEKDMQKATSLIKSYLERKLGVNLYQKFGIDYYKGKNTGKGIRYILPDYRQIRFNFDNDEISSIDIWKPNEIFPAVRIETKGISVVKILPFIIKELQKPVVGEFEVDLVEEPEKTVTTEAKIIKINNTVYPTQKAAVIDLLKKNTPTKEIIRLTGAAPSLISVIKKDIGLVTNVKVLTAGPEENNNPDILKLQEKLDEIEYADPEIVYEDLDILVRQIAKGKIYSLLITGMPGVGKSWIVEHVLTQEVGEKNKDWIYKKGIASSFGIYEILYENNGKIIVFDDLSDQIFKDENTIAVLKAALDNKQKREIFWQTKTPLVFNPSDFSDLELKTLLDMGKIPNRFEFTGKAIFITNLHQRKIPSSILSRSVHIDITLRRKDVISKIKQILPNIQPDIDMKYKLKLLDFIDKNGEKMKSTFDIRKFDNAITLVQPLMAAGVSNWQRLVLNYI